MKKIYCITFLLLLLTKLLVAQAPVISSFSPSSAPVGATVIITGTNFDPVPDSNTVYFGGTRASIIAASNTSITATVPQGSSFQFITVKVDSLTGFSKQPFITTFGAGASLRNNSFGEPATIAAAQLPCFADFDNDGLVDMAAFTVNNKISLYKNLSAAGNLALATGIPYTTLSSPAQLIAADFNADGKLDLASIGTGSAAVALYANISSSGNIAFTSPVYYLLGTDNIPYSIDANDIDGDGNTDLVVGYSHSGTCFSIARNNGTGGNISFANRVNYSFGAVPGGSGNVGDANKIIAADVDGDGKVDVLSRSRFFNPFLIFRNTSIPGTVSFAAKTVITSNRVTSIANGYFDFKLADFDGDRKPDIVYVSSDSAQLSFYRNTSMPGDISYAAKTDVPGGYYALALAVNDMNGDGKPDVGAVYPDSGMIIKNKSTTGSILMDTRKMFWTGEYATQAIALADLDTDGKADIIVSGTDVNNNNSNKTTILSNIIGETAAVKLCTGADSVVLETDIAGTVYQWQLNTGNGFVNIADDTSNTGSNTSSLLLRHLASSMYGYQYRCVVDGVEGSIQYLKFTATWTGSFSNIWENPGNWQCGILPDTNTDVVINYGIVRIASNVLVRSIKVAPGCNVTVAFGFNLDVSH